MNEDAKPGYRKILSNRSTLSLWIGEIVSQSGDYVFAIALPWLVLLRTGSALWVSVTNAVAWMPLLLSSIAGVYVDRTNRKTSVVMGNVIQGIAGVSIALLYATGVLALPTLLILVFILYFFDQFVSTAIDAIIPKLAESKGELAAVNALFSMSSSTNRIAGYIIGGGVVAVLGVEVPILYDGTTFLFAAIITFAFVSSLYGRVQKKPNEATNPSLGKRSFRTDFAEGARLVKDNKLFLELTIVLIAVNFFTGGTSALIAPYVAESLHLGSLGFGIVVSSLGAGGILGSYAFGKMNVREHVGRLFFTMALMDGIALLAMGLFPYVYLALLAFLIFGLANTLVELPVTTLIQARVPNEVLGRVFAVIITLGNAAAPAAAILAGGFTLAVSTRGVFAYFGFGVIVTALLSYAIFGELRAARY